MSNEGARAGTTESHRSATGRQPPEKFVAGVEAARGDKLVECDGQLIRPTAQHLITGTHLFYYAGEAFERGEALTCTRASYVFKTAD